ncbi:aspartic proteinase nepenthesin-1-like [Ananas comosus]|nr:aspartic proteinase nepenthesin-1-like [Ananas comosus]
MRIEVTHVNSDGNYTMAELIRRAAARDTVRLAGARANVTTPLHYSTAGGYLMELAVGTPPVPYLGLADTGSTLVWIECLPCKNCTDLVVPKYDPHKSPTFSSLPCNSSLCEALDFRGSCLKGSCTYNIVYGSGATVGVLGSEIFTFGSSEPVSVPDIGFGCSTDSLGDYGNSSGIVGLGKSSLSLVSQLGVGKFSYCLTSYYDIRSTSSLFFGSSASLSGTAVKSTAFVRNPNSTFASFYYLPLKGISLGATLLPVPSTAFAIRTDGSGGLIIDSGTTFTYLGDVAYQLVKQAIQSLVNRPPADGLKLELDLCYSLRPPPPQMPNMTFHFDGADMNLPVDNYMISDSETGLWCLAMLNSTDNSSILGNFQQQNMHILYDLDNDVLSFVPAQCSKL